MLFRSLRRGWSAGFFICGMPSETLDRAEQGDFDEVGLAELCCRRNCSPPCSAPVVNEKFIVTNDRKLRGGRQGLGACVRFVRRAMMEHSPDWGEVEGGDERFAIVTSKSAPFTIRRVRHRKSKRPARKEGPSAPVSQTTFGRFPKSLN